MMIKSFFWHLHTVNKHRREVRKLCFKMWLYWQWLTHDLSKYTPAEFWIWVKYFQWFRSPNVMEREKKWYSSAWLHHKGRNKHHYEYWNDQINWVYKPVKMPLKYMKETFCDMVAASKIYKWNDYKCFHVLEYFNLHTDRNRIDFYVWKELQSWFEMLVERWEDETIKYIKNLK